MNATWERFNRTLREQFIEFNELLLLKGWIYLIKEWFQKCPSFGRLPRHGCRFRPVSAQTQSVLRYSGSFSWRCASLWDGRKTGDFSLAWHCFQRGDQTHTSPCLTAAKRLICWCLVKQMASCCTDPKKLDRIIEASQKESMKYMGFFLFSVKVK